MASRFRNDSVESMLVGCEHELDGIEGLIRSSGGGTSPVTRYLTNYSIVRACGTVEQSFKALVADRVTDGHSVQIRSYIDQRIRYSSMNPSFDNICNLLKAFDSNWHTEFKTKVPDSRLRVSLKSLNELRNTFAHGGHPSASFNDVKRYYEDAVIVLKAIEDVIR